MDNNKYSAQLFHFFTGHIITRGIGLVSMPLLTRLLTVSDYGILGLVTDTIVIGVLVAKMGLQQSVIRFYQESQTEDPEARATFYSTFLITAILTGLVITGIFVSLLHLIPSRILGKQAISILSFSSILIATGCISAFLTTFLRAEQKTKLYNFLTVALRAGSLLISFFFLFFFVKGITGFFLGSVIWAILSTICLIKIILPNKGLALRDFSFDLLKKAVKYGLPLTIMEISHSLLNFGDRYVIQYYLGPGPLGIYSAGYTISMEVVQLLDYPLLSVVPVIYFELWNKYGLEAVQEYLRKMLNYFVLAAVPISFGFIALSEEIVSLIASSKYVESAAIMPLVTIGAIIFASSTLFSAGLYIHKKSLIPAAAMGISALLNLGLNFLLVPSYGIMGSALATFIGYASYLVIIIPCAFRYLSYKPDIYPILRYFLYGIVMYCGIIHLGSGTLLGRLLIRSTIGAVIYSAFIFAFERDIRAKAIRFYANLKFRAPL